MELDKVEELLKLVVKYKVDLLELDGLKIVKTKFDDELTPLKPKITTIDEDLFDDGGGAYSVTHKVNK